MPDGETINGAGGGFEPECSNEYSYSDSFNHWVELECDGLDWVVWVFFPFGLVTRGIFSGLMEWVDKRAKGGMSNA